MDHGHEEAHGDDHGHDEGDSGEMVPSVFGQYTSYIIWGAVILAVLGGCWFWFVADWVMPTVGGRGNASAPVEQVSDKIWREHPPAYDYREPEQAPVVQAPTQTKTLATIPAPTEETVEVVRAKLHEPFVVRPSARDGWTPFVELPAGTRFRRYDPMMGTGSVTTPYECRVKEEHAVLSPGSTGDCTIGSRGEKLVRWHRLDTPGNTAFERFNLEIVEYDWQGDGGPPPRR